MLQHHGLFTQIILFTVSFVELILHAGQLLPLLQYITLLEEERTVRTGKAERGILVPVAQSGPSYPCSVSAPRSLKRERVSETRDVVECLTDVSHPFILLFNNVQLTYSMLLTEEATMNDIRLHHTTKQVTTSVPWGGLH